MVQKRRENQCKCGCVPVYSPDCGLRDLGADAIDACCPHVYPEQLLLRHSRSFTPGCSGSAAIQHSQLEFGNKHWKRQKHFLPPY